MNWNESLLQADSAAILVPIESDLTTGYPPALARKMQCDTVLEYLKGNFWISKEYAAARFGVMHLPARIGELRNQGFDIVEGRVMDAGLTRWTTVYGLRMPIPDAYFSPLREYGFGEESLIEFFLQLHEAGLLTMPIDKVHQGQLLSAAIFLIQMQIAPRS